MPKQTIIISTVEVLDNMKMQLSSLAKISTIMVLCLSFLVGCSSLIPSPPDLATVEQQLKDNYVDVQVVVDFLINYNTYQDVYISDKSGTMLVGLEREQIDDENVKEAIERLISNKIYFTFLRNGNTIKILQWRGSMDIGAGIAYSINGEDQPIIEYMTDLTPLSMEGWYYYVADYNKWRIENTPSADN